ncbi:MAG: hypothetical protein EPN33_08430 [Acidobacteria bacterium]|nr:MAG: hypothetical protein EPN33_08430 [Acidobacteriota bacterium]
MTKGLSPALLTAVLDRLEEAVLVLDPRQQVRFANAAAAQLLPQPRRLPLLLRRSAEVMASGQPWSGRMPLPDERTLQLRISPLALRGGWAGALGAPSPAERQAAGAAGRGCLVSARDITAAVRLETTRRDFIAAISHELRTPLASIQGYAEMLAQKPEPPAADRAAWLAVIADNAGRLARLIGDLATLSSLETGTYPFHFAALEAAALAAPALAVVTPLARERGVTLRQGALGPGQIRGDAPALERVLLNLLENAILHGHSPVETHRLRVELSGGVRQGAYEFLVRDTGAGISTRDQPRIFERFYRVQPAPGRSGSGLGLALVKHIVHEHSGEVTVESTLGAGSAFRVRLPLVERASRSAQPSGAPRQEKAAS